MQKTKIIWRTDANGKIGSDKGKEKDIAERDARRKIGPYTRAKSRKGKGTPLAGICRRQKMIPTVTRKEPKKKDRYMENTKTEKL